MTTSSGRISVSRRSDLNEILIEYLRTIDPHAWPGTDGLTLDVMLESYSRAASVGQVPGKDELLRQHPELAPELESLFAGPASLPHSSAGPVISPLYSERTD